MPQLRTTRLGSPVAQADTEVGGESVEASAAEPDVVPTPRTDSASEIEGGFAGDAQIIGDRSLSSTATSVAQHRPRWVVGTARVPRGCNLRQL